MENEPSLLSVERREHACKWLQWLSIGSGVVAGCGVRESNLHKFWAFENCWKIFLSFLYGL